MTRESLRNVRSWSSSYPSHVVSTTQPSKWLRLFAELFGTFLVVLAGAGAVVVGAITRG